MYKEVTDGSRSDLVDTGISTFFAGDLVQLGPDVGVIVCKPVGVSTRSPLVVMETKIQRAMAEFDPRTYHDALCIRSFVDGLSSAEVREIEGEILSNIVQLSMKTLVKTSRIAGYEHVLVGRQRNPINPSVTETPCSPTTILACECVAAGLLKSLDNLASP
jgi:hypothetical protein